MVKLLFADVTNDMYLSPIYQAEVTGVMEARGGSMGVNLPTALHLVWPQTLAFLQHKNNDLNRAAMLQDIIDGYIKRFKNTGTLVLNCYYEYKRDLEEKWGKKHKGHKQTASSYNVQT